MDHFYQVGVKMENIWNRHLVWICLVLTLFPDFISIICVFICIFFFLCGVCFSFLFLQSFCLSLFDPSSNCHCSFSWSCCCCPVDSKQIWISNTQLLNAAIPKASDFFKSVPAARGLLTMPAQEPSSRGSLYDTGPTHFSGFCWKKMSRKITSNACSNIPNPWLHCMFRKTSRLSCHVSLRWRYWIHASDTKVACDGIEGSFFCEDNRAKIRKVNISSAKKKMAKRKTPRHAKLCCSHYQKGVTPWQKKKNTAKNLTRKKNPPEPKNE